MPTAELEKLIESLDVESYSAVVKFATFLSESQGKPESSKRSIRLGIAKDEFDVPDDIDGCNDEIAEMFGVA